jgi:hypothetical protein
VPRPEKRISMNEIIVRWIHCNSNSSWHFLQVTICVYLFDWIGVCTVYNTYIFIYTIRDSVLHTYRELSFCVVKVPLYNVSSLWLVLLLSIIFLNRNNEFWNAIIKSNTGEDACSLYLFNTLVVTLLLSCRFLLQLISFSIYFDSIHWSCQIFEDHYNCSYCLILYISALKN